MSNKSSPHGGYICEGTVVSGAHTTQSLLRALADEYARVLPFNSSDACHVAREAADARDAGGDPGEAADILDWLCDALDLLAEREGLTFCEEPAGSGNYGYWDIAEEDKA